LKLAICALSSPTLILRDKLSLEGSVHRLFSLKVNETIHPWRCAPFILKSKFTRAPVLKFTIAKKELTVTSLSLHPSLGRQLGMRRWSVVGCRVSRGRCWVLGVAGWSAGWSAGHAELSSTGGQLLTLLWVNHPPVGRKMSEKLEPPVKMPTKIPGCTARVSRISID
jgi:hypothetical protein